MPKIVDHARQRIALSATTADLIAAQGLENTSLRSVATFHGCTKGMVQHYFMDKEQLLQGALDYVEARFEQSVQAASAGQSGLQATHAVLLAQLPAGESLCRDWQVRLVFRTRGNLPAPMRQQLQAYHEQQEGTLMRALHQAQRAKQLRRGLSIRNSGRSLLALLWGMGVDAVEQPSRTPLSARRLILKNAIDGLRA